MAEEMGKIVIMGDDMSEKAVDISSDCQKMVDLYFSKINHPNYNIAEYGIISQNKLSSFSESVLKQMRSKNVDEINSVLKELIVELKTFDKKIVGWKFSHLFETAQERVKRINGEYSKIERAMKSIEIHLEKQHQSLLVDINLLDKMFELNRQNFNDISIYIHAGKLKLRDIDAKLLLQLKGDEQAVDGSNPNSQTLILEELAKRIERRMHDLDLSKIISLQLASQIQVIKSNNIVLAEKLQSSINNTIPLWCSQMILSLNVSSSQQMLRNQNFISRFVEKIVKRNSNSVARANYDLSRRMSNDSFDVSKFREINTNLLSSLNETMSIQQDLLNRRSELERSMMCNN